ncbi:MAG TPA: hypothetical protein VHO28_07810 [Ignavibacteriales bacterium]|nr:hypothetical protein [Ignavibacteriales bacterium]
MKKLTALFIFFTICSFAQSDSPKIISIITIMRNNNYTEAWGETNESGFISGVLYSDYKRQFIGNEHKPNNLFLESFSEFYSDKKNFLDKKMTEEGSEKFYDNRSNSNISFGNADKILQYSFYPEIINDKDSSLLLYCKYILYERKEQIAVNKFNYETTYYEKFYRVKINTDISLDFLKEIFPEAEYISATFQIDKNINNYSSLDVSAYSMNINDIKESVKMPPQDSSLRIAAEYIRSDKKGEKILTTKDFYCDSKKRFVYSGLNLTAGFPLNIYEGTAEAPFEIYAPQKKELFAKSKEFKNTLVICWLMFIPVNKENGLYTFDVAISRGILHGTQSYLKRIGLRIGEQIRIKLDDMSGLYREEIVDDQTLDWDIKKDYSDYVNEYLIIGLKK